MADKATGNKVKPPYTAANDIDTFFDKLHNVAPPAAPITTPWVEAKKLAQTQPSGITSMLRWLGVTDENNLIKADLWNKLRAGKTRQQTLESLVRDSYEAVFTQFNDIAEATRDDIDGAFITAYQTGDTGRLRTCFLKLCEKAGIKVVPARTLKRESKRTESRPSASSTPKPSSSSSTSKPPPKSKLDDTKTFQGATSPTVSLLIEIPASWTEEQIRDRIAIVKRVAQEPDAAS